MNRPLLLLILGGFFALSGLLHAEGRPPAIVSTMPAVNKSIAPYVWVTGTVIGRFDSHISAEVEGQLEMILDVGDRVEKGDVIAKVEDTIYKLALNEIQSGIKPIETMVEFYKMEVSRLDSLSKKNNAAKNLLDETEASRDEALARIRMIRARLASARDDLARTEIRAPFPGVISERIKSPGERVEQNDEIVRLINVDKLEVRAYIRRRAYHNIQINDALLIEGSETKLTGKVRTLIPVGASQSRLYEIRVEFENPDWHAGTAVRVSTPIDTERRVVAVPRDALVIRQSGTMIYRINADNIAELIPVKTGIADSDYIEVLGNVAAGDQIVIRGNERLRPGQSVQITNTTINSAG